MKAEIRFTPWHAGSPTDWTGHPTKQERATYVVGSYFGMWLCGRISLIYQIPKCKRIWFVVSDKPDRTLGNICNEILHDGRVRHSDGTTHSTTVGFQCWLEAQYARGARYIWAEYQE